MGSCTRSSDVFKSISAHSEVLAPQMILVTIFDNELFELKLHAALDRPTWSCAYGDVCCCGVELPG